MPIRRSGVGLRHSYSSSTDVAVSGLQFAANTTANSDVRLIWDSTNLLDRLSHTAFWKIKFFQQTGFYAVAWHSHNNGVFNNGTNGTYEFGTHPYPSDTGGVDGSGQNTGSFGDGSIHYHEVAGLGAHDYLATGGSSSLLLVTGSELLQVRRCYLSGGNYVHEFYPDLVGNPSFVIRQNVATGNMDTGGGSAAFYIGCSDWRNGQGGGGAGTNDETPGCTYIRCIGLFAGNLSNADCLTEANAGGNNAVTSNGQSLLWYMNKNPTHTDVSDKSPAGHSPRWDSARRPTTFTF